MILTLPLCIETHRIRIRLFTKKDEPQFIDFMMDEIATRFLLFTDQQKTKKGAREILKETIASYSTNNPSYAFVVADIKTDEYLGSVGIMPVTSTCCEIYWSIQRSFWNRGFGTEATNALIDYLANHTKINKITAHTHPNNIASSRIAERCNFMYQGIVPHPIMGKDARKYIIIIS